MGLAREHDRRFGDCSCDPVIMLTATERGRAGSRRAGLKSSDIDVFEFAEALLLFACASARHGRRPSA